MDTSLTKHLPILIFPNSLDFYLDSRDRQKNILTIYNPYDIPVRFNVQSNAPNKYTIVDSAGTIGPSCRVDLVIRHVQPIAANCNVLDKFKILMYDYHKKSILGQRIVKSMLLEGVQRKEDSEENFPPFSEITTQPTTPPKWVKQRDLESNSSINYIAVAAGVVCILVLFLPNPDDKTRESFIQKYLPSNMWHLKLICSYVLGLASMALLKP